MKHILIAAVIVLLCACGRGSHAHDHDNHSHTHDHSGECPHYHDHDHDHDHGPVAAGVHSDDPEDIIFTAAQAAMTGFEVAEVRRGTFREVIKTSGVISPAQGEQVTVVAPISGIISLGSRALVEGGAVSSGTALFWIKTSGIEGGDVVAKLRSALNKAKLDYERALSLSEDNIVSRAELDAARAAYEIAQAEYDSLGDADRGAGVSVASPMAGYVFGLNATRGDYVDKGQPILSVVRNNVMELQAEVSQRYYDKLRNVTDANFTVPTSDRLYNVAELGGVLASVGGAVRQSSPMVPVVFRFGYTSGLLPGSFAEVHLLGAERDGVISLPVEAVTEQMGLYYVYVRTGGDVYRRRQVVTGGNDGRRIEIMSGLTEGEQVVVRGAVNVRMASASGAIPHSHEH